MPSIQNIGRDPELQALSRIAVFRCKRKHPVHTENIRRLSAGWTGWWKVDVDQKFDGVAVLIDAVHSKSVEAWVGVMSGRRQRRSDGRWRLDAANGFRCVDILDERAVKAYMGKQPGNGVTYVELHRTPDPSNVPTAKESPTRGFNPEFSGDRAAVPHPSGYTAQSTHGRIVTALHKRLCSLNYSNIDNKTGYWDLHGYCPRDQPTLFEVKTRADTASVFCAIGQLLMYEQEVGFSRKVAVLPVSAPVSTKLRQRLSMLDIDLVTHEECQGEFRFDGL
jgi:hypothetical protein